jgi:hypothetical protein
MEVCRHTHLEGNLEASTSPRAATSTRSFTCRIELQLAAGAIVFFVVRLGTAIPNPPANIGTFQFF